MRTLSVLIPAYNEEATIGVLLNKLVETSLRIQRINGLSFEIVVVNDGSNDKTGDIVLRFASEHSEVNLKYRHQPNAGKGSAIRTALNIATGDIFVVQDADLEYEPDDFLIMLPYILNGDYEVVYGSRFLNHQNKHSYRSFYLGGRVVTAVANILYNLSLTDEPTCYKMFTREVLQKIKLDCTGFEFCPEFTAKAAKAGYDIIEVPIHYYPRTIYEGKKISWKDGIKAVRTLLKYMFIK